jgi:hypothetical protein
MLRFLTVVSLVLFCACANDAATANADQRDTALSSQTPHNNGDATGVIGAKPIALNGCYQMTLKRDTATLNLSVKDTTVTGTLRYDWHEKDRSNGTIKGVLRNNSIYADYTFESEGMTSVREVVFKIQDTVLLQGFGALTEENGKIIFQHRDSLQFDTIHPFLKIMCL